MSSAAESLFLLRGDARCSDLEDSGEVVELVDQSVKAAALGDSRACHDHGHTHATFLGVGFAILEGEVVGDDLGGFLAPRLHYQS